MTNNNEQLPEIKFITDKVTSQVTELDKSANKVKFLKGIKRDGVVWYLYEAGKEDNHWFVRISKESMVVAKATKEVVESINS